MKMALHFLAERHDVRDWVRTDGQSISMTNRLLVFLFRSSKTPGWPGQLWLGGAAARCFVIRPQAQDPTSNRSPVFYPDRRERVTRKRTANGRQCTRMILVVGCPSGALENSGVIVVQVAILP